ncbi:MAG: hypothetical protein JAZ11_11645 [Candidatus Thiodiazotropha lotti]|nr:hypothetical protein [Candidatus Thiodiazotropha lotti]
MNTECQPEQIEFHGLGKREVIGKDVLIDPLMAYGEMFFLLKPKADLFWAPLFPEQRVNQTPIIQANTDTDFALTSIASQLMGLLGTIAPQATVAA